MREDTLLKKAKEVVLKYRKVSPTFLQRKLHIGYSRSAMIIDILEEEGFIGPCNGAKPRKILNKTV